MTLEQLIANLRDQINKRIDSYNKLTTELNELRQAATPDDAAVEAKVAEREAVMKEIDPLKARLAAFEDELKQDEAVRRLQSEVGPEQRKAGDGEEREERIQVNELRIYRKDIDKRGLGTQFMTDVAGALLGNWDSRQRLDEHMRQEKGERPDIFARAAGTGAFAGFVVPQYLIDLNVGQATPKRPFANIARHHDLPPTGMTAYLSKITTGTSVDIQSSENSAVAEQDIDDTLISISIQTAAGSQTLSRQAIERGLGTEDITWADLQKRHAAKLDSTMLNQATNGLTNVATAVTYTDASPTAPEVYPKILGAISAGEAIFLNDAEVDYVLMHSRRWRWISSQMTSSWPFVNGSRVAPQAGAVTTEGTGYDMGVRGYLPDGTAVITDNNIATNLGAGTNEDEIYSVASSEVHLWEDPAGPMFLRAEQTNAKKLGIDLVLYSYFAYYLNRYTGGHGKVAGTGNVTPTF